MLGIAALLVAIVGVYATRSCIWAAWYIYRDYQEFPTEAVLNPGFSINLPLIPPQSAAWRFQNSFPNLELDLPTVAVFTPRGSVYVLERRGKLWVFQNDPTVDTKMLVLDVSDQVGQLHGEEGAVGLALHPGFGLAGENGHYLYLYFTSHFGGQLFDRLSRYTLDSSYESVVPGSELRLLNLQDEHYDHNGGTLVFGPDGFLYVSLGDEGNCDCKNDQRIDKDLFGGILRIDVDRRADLSHPVRRQPDTGRTAGYFIPNDNPFVGVENALEEFWAIGLRNPFRIAFDPKTGRLFAGDVGAARVESIVEIHRGSNHRWNYYEGNLEHRFKTGDRPNKIYGSETEPLFTYSHKNMNLAVIGGQVYHGKKLAALAGRYIYGDNASGRVWALDLETMENQYVASLSDRASNGLAGFSVDPDGELYAISMGSGSGDGTIRKLVPTESGHRGALPEKLSETGLFEDTSEMRPNQNAFAYQSNLPMWRGIPDVEVRRWAVKLGNSSDPTFHAHQPWGVNGGMVFGEHFEHLGVRLETQILVVASEELAYGLSYRWNEEGSDAVLVTRSETAPVAGGAWRFSSSGECSMCHNRANGLTLGFNTAQLNVGNQLVDLRTAGVFEPRFHIVRRMWGRVKPVRALAELQAIAKKLATEPLVQSRLLDTYPRLYATHSGASLEERALSYLDVNCATCHKPGGVAGTTFDARFSTPLAKKGLLRKEAQRSIDDARILVVPGDPGASLILRRLRSPVPGVQMPPVGLGRPDPDGIALIEAWIASLIP